MSFDDAFPPFEPDGPPPRSARSRGPLRDIPLRYLLPNIATVLAICAGLSAVRMAVEGRFALAVGLILAAAILDALDGRIARLMRASSKFGAEMDSLADVVNFGVVPGLVLYLYVLDEAAQFGWVAVLIYVVACALRLARFNIMAGDADRPKWQQGFFVGVPAPGAAFLALLPVYIGFLGVEPGLVTAGFVSVYVMVIGVLMVSSLPVWSGKTMVGVPRSAVMPLILVVAAYVALVATFTWSTLTISAVAYIAFLPVSYRMWKKAQKRAETEAAKEAGAEAG